MSLGILKVTSCKTHLYYLKIFEITNEQEINRVQSINAYYLKVDVHLELHIKYI